MHRDLADTRDLAFAGARGWWSLIEDVHIGGFWPRWHPLRGQRQCRHGFLVSRLDDAASTTHINIYEQNRKKQKNQKNLRLLRIGTRHRSGLCRERSCLRRDSAKNGVGLVFGGGSVGMMGAIAKSVLDHGGKVTGIIPEFLVAREHAMRGADNLIVTRDMHERKRKMFEMADAFVAMPGGIGTLEEVVEQMTWVQLGRHRKPILLCEYQAFLGTSSAH